MTKKHFEAFAAEIREIEDMNERRAAATAVKRVCERFSSTFSASRFFIACGVL